jgi:hypothetical protein
MEYKVMAEVQMNKVDTEQRVLQLRAAPLWTITWQAVVKLQWEKDQTVTHGAQGGDISAKGQSKRVQKQVLRAVNKEQRVLQLGAASLDINLAGCHKVTMCKQRTVTHRAQGGDRSAKEQSKQTNKS